MCDAEISTVFGRRNINERDASLHCCTTDLCNIPIIQTTSTTTTTTTTQGKVGLCLE